GSRHGARRVDGHEQAPLDARAVELDGVDLAADLELPPGAHGRPADERRGRLDHDLLGDRSGARVRTGHRAEHREHDGTDGARGGDPEEHLGILGDVEQDAAIRAGGRRTLPGPCDGQRVLKAASNAAPGGSNANLWTNSIASGAPTSRSIPASSHSTERGPW